VSPQVIFTVFSSLSPQGHRWELAAFRKQPREPSFAPRQAAWAGR
jgi:hypothetical protein